MAKVVQKKLDRLVIEAVRNGFRVLIPHKSSTLTASDITKASLQMLYDSLTPTPTIGGSLTQSRQWSATPKKAEVPPIPAPYGEYVFSDFASLSVFLKAYLKHGKGIEE